MVKNTIIIKSRGVFLFLFYCYYLFIFFTSEQTQANKYLHLLQYFTAHSCIAKRVALWWLLLPLPWGAGCPRCVLLSLSSLLWCISLGKWLWWCQLTPHCHPRFVSQTHCPRHPYTSTSFSPTSCYCRCLLSPSLSHPPEGFFFLSLWCLHLYSNTLFLLPFGFLSEYQWWHMVHITHDWYHQPCTFS